MNKRKSTVDVKAVRQAAGLNQTDFWKRLGCTQSGGSRYEAGRGLPGPLAILFDLVFSGDAKAAHAKLDALRGDGCEVASIGEQLSSALLRIDKVIFIGGAISQELLGDDLDSFLDEEDEETIVKCLGEIPDYVDIDARSYELAECVFDWLNSAGKKGYLVKFATPVMTPHRGGSRSYSWGHYNTEWVYAESVDASIQTGLEWAESRRKSEDEKAAKGGKS